MNINCPEADRQQDHHFSRLGKNVPPARHWAGYSAMTALIFMLSACLAPQIKPPNNKFETLSRILVVPMETPPLEIFPDPMINAALGYGQNLYDSLPLSPTISEQVYRHPGGVLTAGHMENGATQNTAIQPSTILGMRPLAELHDYWLSSLAIAEQTVARLNSTHHYAVLSSHYRPLPMPDEDRTAYLGNWRNAYQSWYNDEAAAVDYRQFAADHVDAVLEVGVGNYRVFYGQVSLQLLLKLIDPASGEVIGRIDVKDYRVENSSDALLADDAAQFKAVINEMGAHLAASGLDALGLNPAAREHSATTQHTAITTVAR